MIALLRRWFSCIVFGLGGLAQADNSIQFNRDVRPILSDNCFQCHGPDSRTRGADLRLDTREGLLESGNVLPGQPADSPLYQRIIATDTSERMPPADSHKQLSFQQVIMLEQWIKQGAQYQGHWSFQPLAHPDLEKFPSDTLPHQVIDFFIDQQLDRQQLQASPQADPITLLRRLSLDLTGLPPSPMQIDQFINNRSEDAYALEVERLLASPHFGERLAMWWLDLVRYADTVGYHGDQEMSVWPYRDYVINAFNSNKPFDLFTIEQLAGDLLPNPTRDQLIASGYNRLGMMSAEGGVQDKEYLAKYIAERVRNVTGTWLGITMGCCECHDHKFDPLSSTEFYKMEAFFADIKERGLYSGANSDGNWGPNIKVPTDEQAAKLADLDGKIAQVQQHMTEPDPLLISAQAEWESQQRQWVPLHPVYVQSKRGATLTIGQDATITASGNNPDNDEYQIIVEGLPEGCTALRLEVIPDDSLPNKGPGRAGNGNFVLSELIAQFVVADGTESLTFSSSEKDSAPVLQFQTAAASYEQTGAVGANPYGKWTVAAAIDQDAKGKQWGWAVMEQVGRHNFAVFQLQEALAAVEPNQRLQLTLQHNLESPQHTIGKFRLWATNSRAISANQLILPADIAEIVEIDKQQREQAQRTKLENYYRSIAPQLQPLRDQLAALQKSKAELDAQIPTTLITQAVAPRTVRVLPRGNWMDESGPEVSPGYPVAITLARYSISDPRRLTRMDLANWILARENPLTARVVVNRLWKLYLGTGLSRKLDDLGAQGEPPSHPELLDYLATRLIDSGWDIKQLIRTIVATRAYQRSSQAASSVVQADPQNRWLARQARFRLDAELVRDNALAVSGLLVDSVGGKSVKPYQPPGYWAYLNFPTREWANGTGAELYRRGLYTHWQRQYLHPSLMAFDAPSREECTAERPRSNTPLQALALLNDPTYVEAARALAVRLLEQTNATDQQRFELLFRLALSRLPREAETSQLGELLDRSRSEYMSNAENVQQLATVGAMVNKSTVDAQDVAAWTAVTRVVLNLHETVTRN